MTHRTLRVVAVVLLVLSGLGLMPSGTILAAQTADCTGIEEYLTALEVAGTELESAMPENDDSDLGSWTSEDFTAASDAITTAQEAFAEIEPPTIAEEFHALLLEMFGMISQMFDTMATTGVFGALIFAEQIDTVNTELDDAAQEIETTCGVELMETLGDESIVADTASASPVVVTDTSSGDFGASTKSIGTRENPIPYGQTAQITAEWEMTVIAVTPDATDLILAENSYNEAPAAGQQFFMATVRLTSIGQTSDEFYTSDLNAVGQLAVGYNQYDDDCGSIPNELPSREVFTGGTIEGNVCWSIATEDADSRILYDNYGPSEDRVYLSMISEGSAEGTPEAATR